MKLICQYFSLVIFTLIISVIDLAAQANDSWKASESVIERLSKDRTNINYHEEKVPSYILPDPLMSANGRKVSNAGQWTENRRDEVLELFRENVFGRVPSRPALKTRGSPW